MLLNRSRRAELAPITEVALMDPLGAVLAALHERLDALGRRPTVAAAAARVKAIRESRAAVAQELRDAQAKYLGDNHPNGHVTGKAVIAKAAELAEVDKRLTEARRDLAAARQQLQPELEAIIGSFRPSIASAIADALATVERAMRLELEVHQFALRTGLSFNATMLQRDLGILGEEARRIAELT